MHFDSLSVSVRSVIIDSSADCGEATPHRRSGKGMALTRDDSFSSLAGRRALLLCRSQKLLLRVQYLHPRFSGCRLCLWHLGMT